MSQLDNNENKVVNENNDKFDETKKTKKDKKPFWTKKNVIIFLAIFTIMSVEITSALIYVQKNQPKETNNDKEKIVKKIKSDGYGVNSLDEKYTFNNLNITRERYTEGKEVYVDDYEGSYYPLEIQYIKIDGLKNKEVENKINDEIKEKSIELAKKGENYGRVSVEIWCEGNFSNILSLEVYRFSNNPGNYDGDYKYDNKFMCLNFDLNTGDQIKFEDLFTNDANIKNIITQSAYTSLARKYLSDEENEDIEDLTADMEKMKNNYLEELVLEVLDDYYSGKHFDFYFTPRYAYMFFDGKDSYEDMIEIRLADFYKNIAIFKRFKNDRELFEDNSIRECKVFFDRQNYFGGAFLEQTNIGEISDRLFVNSIYMFSDYDKNDRISYDSVNNSIKKVAKHMSREIDNKIDNYKKYLERNKDKALIIGIIVSINYDSKDENLIGVYYSIYEYSMDKEYYEENLYDNIIVDKMIYYIEGGSFESMASIYDENMNEKDDFGLYRRYNIDDNTYTVNKNERDEETGELTSDKILTYDISTNKLISEEDLLEEKTEEQEPENNNSDNISENNEQNNNQNEADASITDTAEITDTTDALDEEEDDIDIDAELELFFQEIFEDIETGDVIY